jgi:hypothetical protein
VKSDHETSEPTPEANDDAQELSDDELDEVAGGGPVIEYEGDLQP